MHQPNIRLSLSQLEPPPPLQDYQIIYKTDDSLGELESLQELIHFIVVFFVNNGFAYDTIYLL